tara:strand:+ start:3688 stop:5031 length:1344 start_codon:yes stop_codon:yes gene_type:complete
MNQNIIKKIVPKSLLGRSLVIVFLPIIFLVIITSFVFYQTSWDIISKRLTQSVSGDIGAVIELLEENKLDEAKNVIEPKLNLEEAKLLAQKYFNFDIKLLTNEYLNIKDFSPKQRIFSRRLNEALKNLGKEFVFDTTNLDKGLKIKIQLDNDILIIDVNKDRLYGGRAFVFILWMIFSSFILFLIAYIFLKNQTRPLKKLSILAETFGRGLDTPILKASGAIEIKQTTNAFNLMRTRIKRFLKQRTEMLAGVSHDLRTPLTRMKLQISMLKDEKLKDELQDDILEMTSMLDSYLSFTRGEALDPIEEIDFEKLLKDLIENLKNEKNRIELINNKNTISSGRPAQIKRSLVNIVENAKRYAEFIRIILDKKNEQVLIDIEDNGPGIQSIHYKEVFRPFYTLDKSRNKATGGSGLGMTIARDIIRSHGGDITLEKSSFGGLKVKINLPI